MSTQDSVLHGASDAKFNIPHHIPDYSLVQSSSTTAPRRIYLHPSSPDADNSPSRRAISFSSWTRFTAHGTPTPFGQLKASILCKGSGTSASYDPPASEWMYTGVEQPLFVGKPVETRRRGRSPLRKERLIDEIDEMEREMETDFRRQPIKRPSLESQLTISILAAPSRDLMGITLTMRKYGLEGFTCEDLPSAFDSDDDAY